MNKHVVRFLRIVRNTSPAKLTLVGYASYMLVGWGLLCLPPFQEEGASASLLDNLFVAVSAVSTTGLSPVTVGQSYSIFGEIVILALIQLGGVGYMTLTSFVILAGSHHLSSVRRDIGAVTFSLPEGFKLERFIRNVILFTLALEFVGFLAILPFFLGRGLEQPVWNALFHSVSAFCTAGFSLFDTGLEYFAVDSWVISVIGILSFLGAIGFVVMSDLWRRAIGETSELTLTTKIILWSTFRLLFIGTALLWIFDNRIASLPFWERFSAGQFQAVTAITTVGFNTIPIGEMTAPGVVVIMVFMVVGASPSGTGGGLKCTTFTAIQGFVQSALRGDREGAAGALCCQPEKCLEASSPNDAPTCPSLGEST